MSAQAFRRVACEWPRRLDRDEEPVTRIVVICDCGCGERLDGGSSGRSKYRNEKHRHKAYRDRVKTEAEAAGLPSNLSLKRVHAATHPAKRVDDAQSPARKRTRRPRPGVSAYFPRADALAYLVDLLESEPEPGPDDDSPDWLTYTEARDALRKAADRAARR